MSTRLWAAAAVTTMLLVTGAACQPNGTQGEEGSGGLSVVTSVRVSAQVQELSEDLELLAVLNRLQLTNEQLKGLLPTVEKMAQEAREFQPRIEGLEQEWAGALTEKRGLLVRDEAVPVALESRLASLQQQWKTAQEECQAALVPHAGELRALLTPPQLAIVSGQYEATLQAEELLDWLRSLSDNDYGEEASSNAEGLADPAVGLDQELLMNLFNTARAMTDGEYAKARTELAERLVPLYGVSEEQATQQLMELFGHPRLPALLQAKLQAGAVPAG